MCQQINLQIIRNQNRQFSGGANMQHSIHTIERERERVRDKIFFSSVFTRTHFNRTILTLQEILSQKIVWMLVIKYGLIYPIASRSWLIILVANPCTECPSNFALLCWRKLFLVCSVLHFCQINAPKTVFSLKNGEHQ